MSAIQLRDTNESDARQVADIYNYFVERTVVTFEEVPVSAADMATRFREIQSQGLPWLVAEASGEILGYCYASRWKSRSAYRNSVESTIYLKPGFEGRGLGRRLYEALISRLRQSGFHVVIGGAAMPNDASVALHERLGFERVATFRQVGFKHDRWVDVAYWQLVL